MMVPKPIVTQAEDDPSRIDVDLGGQWRDQDQKEACLHRIGGVLDKRFLYEKANPRTIGQIEYCIYETLMLMRRDGDLYGSWSDIWYYDPFGKL